MKTRTEASWKRMQDAESRRVQEALREEFPATDAYRYNSASIRVRVVDPRFEGKSMTRRDNLVEREFRNLPKDLQAQIMNLLMLAPSEIGTIGNSSLWNDEFENPSPSEL